VCIELNVAISAAAAIRLSGNAHFLYVLAKKARYCLFISVEPKVATKEYAGAFMGLGFIQGLGCVRLWLHSGLCVPVGKGYGLWLCEIWKEGVLNRAIGDHVNLDSSLESYSCRN
jgi:hypothetical protein